MNASLMPHRRFTYVCMEAAYPIPAWHCIEGHPIEYAFPTSMSLSANSYLLLRILAGVAVFSVLALLDFRKNGRQATRWKEYVFLLACVAFALIYGMINDQFSVSISWEYFYYGKDLAQALGPDLPPAQLPLRLQAAKIGMMATWSAGLIIGAALLIANNPRPGKPSLPYRVLIRQLLLVLAVTAMCAVYGAIIGYFGYLDWASADFRAMHQQNLWRPSHFTGAWGEHLGAYVGGLLGMVLAVLNIRRRRKRLAREEERAAALVKQLDTARPHASGPA
jgi:hypothetical protein